MPTKPKTEEVVEEPKDKNEAPLTDMLRRVMLATIGAVAIAQEELEAFVNRLVERGAIGVNERVIVISTAHGLKFTDFKVGYHEQTLQDVIARYPNPPVELPADYTAVQRAIDAAIRDLGERYPKGECPAPLHEAGEGARLALGKARERLAQLRGDARPFTPMGEDRYRWLLRSLHFLDEDLSRYRQIGEATIQEAKRLRATFDTSQVQEGQPPPGFGADQVLEHLREEMEHVRNFVIENRLVSVPEGEVRIRETPRYLQPIIGGASYQPPPAFFSGAQTGQFFLPPIPRKMTRAQKQHYHKFILNRWRRNLIVHELYPGHHVQFLHALAQPSRIRKVHDNEMMVEGWAFYCEHLLYEAGLFDGAPSPLPAMNQHFRGVRVFVDLGIHTGEMDFAGAERYMREMLSVKTSDWVTREIVRYITEPTQALSYAVGRQMILDLRKEYRDAKGESGFSLFEFHNRFLSEGSIPLPLIRRKLLA